MAHPKRRHSTTRRDKRRSHDFVTPKTIAIDATTGEIHLRHRAHVPFLIYNYFFNLF